MFNTSVDVLGQQKINVDYIPSMMLKLTQTCVKLTQFLCQTNTNLC